MSSLSNDRVFESSLRQHLRRSRHDGKRYSRPQNFLGGLDLLDRFFKRGLDQHIDDLCAMRNTISQKVVVRKALTEPYLRFEVIGVTEHAGRANLRKGDLTLVTVNQQRCSKPAKTHMDGRDAVSPQISSLGGRVRPRMSVSSKGAYTNIYDDLGTKGDANSYKVVVRNAFTHPYLRIAVKKITEYVGRSFLAEGASSWLPSTHTGVTNPREVFFFLRLEMRCPTLKHLPAPSAQERHPLSWPAEP